MTRRARPSATATRRVRPEPTRRVSPGRTRRARPRATAWTRRLSSASDALHEARADASSLAADGGMDLAGEALDDGCLFPLVAARLRRAPVQGMARVRSGQARPAPWLLTGVSAEVSGVKRDVTCTLTRHFPPVLVALRARSHLRPEGRTRTLSGPSPALSPAEPRNGCQGARVWGGFSPVGPPPAPTGWPLALRSHQWRKTPSWSP